jgi:DNA polymerase III subunit gamma/tau
MSDTEPADLDVPEPDSESLPYQVLARKYRPTAFSGLIGQDVLVRTLTNAFKTGRLAHAFILTGVRGVGKTTTARIIARALNCIGPDGTGEPTTEPCGECEHCKAIAEDRHVDVLEMDAASRTGVDDIRELIDGVRYRPTSARYKVYIIDEVHMLSKNAFNALLKTLEEPPEHVKFIFATTEIRKVPVTVLSRCQRFDLRRVEIQTLENHFSSIAENEGATLSATALHLIARAADGSVRDGLSLLDQAISRAEGEISEAQVRDMLGLADRSQSFQLLEAVMAGDTAAALEQFGRMYVEGADPAAVVEDLLEVVHWLTRVKVVPSVLDDPAIPEIERVRGKEMESQLSMPVLSRAWQMLLKGLGEVRLAPSAKQAAEMVLVRLAYTATLPTPEEALKLLDKGETPVPAESTTTTTSAAPVAPPTMPSPPSPGGGGGQAMARTGTEDAPSPMPSQDVAPNPDPNPDPRPEPPWSDEVSPDNASRSEAAAPPVPTNFDEVLALVEQKREGRLRVYLIDYVHLVSFEPGRIEFRPAEGAPQGLAGQLGDFLSAHTGIRWMVTVSQEPGQPTVSERLAARQHDLEAEAAQHPMVKQVLDTFPGAEIKTVAHVDKGE